jgi:hypothetical protein
MERLSVRSRARGESVDATPSVLADTIRRDYDRVHCPSGH